MQTYVLDEQLRLVPPGTPGELYIGGVGLARGYMHRPDSTAAAFVPDPFSQLPGQRLYRTGDLARYGTDGVLEFLGRADEQVKIRGFRIEPGEIASTLRRHPAISDALVMAHTERSGEPKLIAWLIPAAPHAQFPSKETLLAFLQIYLPDYMIPTRLHFLDAFPLNANGKIDRQALLALGQAADERALAQAYSAPRSELEKAIAAIWQELLEIDQVGLDDDFQALGGHSLLAMQLLARIRAYFQVDLSLVSFFNAPTVAGQVKAILTQETKPGQALHLASLLNKIRTLSPHQMEELGQKLQYT
jgi:acyl carrier protein